jgi:SpoVK/Ycf46/Vps4 family AAA+-type ATPase
MARAELIANIIRASSNGDQEYLYSLVEALIEEEKLKKHSNKARILKQALDETQKEEIKSSNTLDYRKISNLNLKDQDSIYDLYQSSVSLDDLMLSDENLSLVKQIVNEYNNRNYLRSRGVEPRHKLLLTGIPGNGKSSLAQAIGYELDLPIYFINYEHIFNAKLGSSLKALKKLFADLYNENCIIFFDEFDSIAKSRSEEQELGEVKRLVNSLLTSFDRLSSNVFLIAASNFLGNIDKAVYRRFQLKLNLDKPSNQNIEKYLQRFSKLNKIDFLYTETFLKNKLAGCSYSDLEMFCENVKRVTVIQEFNQKKVSKSIIKAELDQIVRSVKYEEISN